ncbi:hypothetical protein B0H16DRAFT_1735464 [Mycena metata]|uniref:Uncharacterized protein n=1 Tax=Mycena metata TaxID=1033252 RepID=A0AAD7MPC7_9AGAR|nr:hypothetical protein B0H16DRAFT_1735464 [Mycena metata]
MHNISPGYPFNGCKLSSVLSSVDIFLPVPLVVDASLLPSLLLLATLITLGNLLHRRNSHFALLPIQSVTAIEVGVDVQGRTTYIVEDPVATDNGPKTLVLASDYASFTEEVPGIYTDGLACTRTGYFSDSGSKCHTDCIHTSGIDRPPSILNWGPAGVDWGKFSESMLTVSTLDLVLTYYLA